jgi:hypothetical protein
MLELDRALIIRGARPFSIPKKNYQAQALVGRNLDGCNRGRKMIGYYFQLKTEIKAVPSSGTRVMCFRSSGMR